MNPMSKIFIALLLTAPVALADDASVKGSMLAAPDVDTVGRTYFPYVHAEYPNRVFWGDSHLHTSYLGSGPGGKYPGT